MSSWRISIATVGVFAIPYAAQAQASDSANVDAVATLESSSSTAEVTPGSALNFGTLRVRGDPSETTTCGFLVSADSATEVGINGGQNAMCEFAGSVSPATFAIACTPAVPFRILAQAGGANGFIFQTVNTSLTNASYFSVETFDEGNVQSQSGVPDFNEVCPASGALSVNVGGVVFINADNDQPGSDLTVGTITLSTFL